MTRRPAISRRSRGGAALNLPVRNQRQPEGAPTYALMGSRSRYQVWDFSDPAPAGFHQVYRQYDPATGQHTATRDANGSEFALGWLADTEQVAESTGPCEEYFPLLVAAGQAEQTAVFDTNDEKFLGAIKEELGFGPCKPPKSSDKG